MNRESVDAACDLLDQVAVFKQKLRRRLKESRQQSERAKWVGTRERNKAVYRVLEKVLKDAEGL